MKQRLTGWQLVTIACVGITGIISLEIYALSQEIDGVLLAGAVAAITAIVAGLGGFKIGHK